MKIMFLIIILSFWKKYSSSHVWPYLTRMFNYNVAIDSELGQIPELKLLIPAVPNICNFKDVQSAWKYVSLGLLC